MPIRTVVCILLLLSACTLLSAQCQDQTCNWGSQGCFVCNGGSGFGCMASSCTSCTTTKCSSGGGGDKGPAPTQGCENLMDHLPSMKLRMAPAGMKEGPSQAQVGFTFAPIAGKDDPAILTAVTLNHKDGLVERATLVNLGEKPISAYQIAWVVGTSPEDAKITLAPVFPVPQGLAAKATLTVPAQPFPPSLYKSGARAAFFVASIQFADGTSWNADLERVKENALPADNSVNDKKKEPVTKRL